MHSCYRPQRSCEGYVFTRVCLSTVGSTWAGTPQDQVHPPGPGILPRTRYTSWDQVHPPGPGTPPGTRYTSPRGGYCCGWYASYWNAFLFCFCFCFLGEGRNGLWTTSAWLGFYHYKEFNIPFCLQQTFEKWRIKIVLIWQTNLDVNFINLIIVRSYFLKNLPSWDLYFGDILDFVQWLLVLAVY